MRNFGVGGRTLLRKADTPETRLPQVIAFATGDVTPYQITLTRADSGASATLTGAADGSIEVTRSDVP